MPLYIVHSERDTVVPVSHGHKIFDGVSTPSHQKKLYIAPHLGKLDAFFVPSINLSCLEHVEAYFQSEKKYMRNMVNFMDQAFSSYHSEDNSIEPIVYQDQKEGL